MARLVRGTTITVTTLVTAQTLHQLIEGATLADLSGADITGGVFFPSTTAATPNPSNAPFWYDPSHEDPIFRVFAAPWNIWLAVGPDRFEIPLRNTSGSLAPRGALVVASGASEFSIATNPSLNALGFLQAATPAGSFGPVATVGIVWALYNSSVSGCDTVVEGRALKAAGTPAGTCCAVNIDASPGSGPFFGHWLETDRSGFSGNLSIKRAMCWGPTLTTGF